MKKIQYWDWEDTFLTIVFTCIVCILGLAAFALFQDHSIKQYYVSAEEHYAYCVKASRSWQADTTVFCSSKIEEVTAYAKALNEQLRQK